MKLIAYLGTTVVVALAAMGCIIGMSAIFSLPVYWLWNGIVPEVFGLKSLTFLQAWGLTILCSFLFKSSNTTTDKSN